MRHVVERGELWTLALNRNLPGKSVLVLNRYCEHVPGRRFYVALAALLSSVVLLAYVVRFSTAAPVLGLVLPLYLGNLWFTLLVLRRPAGTLVQPFERGLRLHEPVVPGFFGLSFLRSFRWESYASG